MQLFSLADRVALITGASRGLGLAMAKGMAAAGAHVVLNARNPEALDACVSEIAAAGGSAEAIAFDVTDEPAAVAAVKQIVADRGRLDILVNNAGMVHRVPTLESDTAGWQKMVDTNLTSLYVLAREAARPMVENGWGRIINIGSVMSLVARPGIISYVATKHAVNGMTKALAVELGGTGVTINAIGPGYFATELNQALVDDPEFTRMVEQRTPVGRWGEPDELVGAAVFLASDAAAYVNGHLLMVDGGMTVNM